MVDRVVPASQSLSSSWGSRINSVTNDSDGSSEPGTPG